MDSRVVDQSEVNENNNEQVTHVEEEHNSPDHEKKSVMNRMKAKARKIKDTIKKHGQQVLDHGNGNQHTSDDGDLVKDKEMVQDPEVHETPIYDSDEDVKSATPASKQVENLGNSGIGFEGANVKGEELYHDPLVEGVSSTTEINQNIATDTDTTKTFAVQEKPEPFEANIERPLDLEEHSQEKGSRPQAYSLYNDQTKDTDPSGAGSDELKDIPPLAESLERMNVHEDPKPTTEPRIQPSIADTEYPSSAGSHDHHVPHFSNETTETRNEYPRETISTDINRNHEILSETQNEYPQETISTDINRNHEIFPETQNEYPQETESTNINRNHEVLSETQNEYPQKTISTDINRNHETLSETQNEYPQEAVSTDINKNHEVLPETQNEYPRETISTDINRNHEILSETQNEYPQETISTNINRNHEILPETQNEYPQETVSTDINRNHEILPETQNEYPQETVSIDINRNHEILSETHNEYPQETISTDINRNHEVLSETHNEYPLETVSTDINRNDEIPSETRETFNTIMNTIENLPGYEKSLETQPKQKSYTDEVEILPETTDETFPPENDEASKLGNNEKDEQQKNENGSNISGSTTEQEKNTGYSLTDKLAPVDGKVAEVGSAEKSKVYGTSTDSNNDGTETKNGVTVKDYFAEKLRPSEDDKALSEVISKALHKGKEEPLKKEDGQLDSEVEKSEKVNEESNVNSPGKGMVDRVKDVFGSWFAKPEENQSPQGAGVSGDLSKNKDYVAEVEQVGQVVDEGRKHE